MRRPDRRAVDAYRAALTRYHGSPPVTIWRRYSLRTRAAAIHLWRTGKPARLQDLPETDTARRRPTEDF